MIRTPQLIFDSSSLQKSQRKQILRKFSFGSFLMSLALGCTPSNADTITSTPTTIKPQPTHINVQEVKSSKDITAWMVESHEMPVVSVALAFKNAGTAEDPKGLSGLSLLVSSMIDEGAGDWNSQEFKKLLLKKNIELTISTSSDIFQITFRTVRENVGDAFRILKTILSQPRFDNDALIRVKTQILTSLEQSLHSERTIASQKLNSLIYGDHPYGQTIQQTLKELPQITDANMRQFIKDHFARDQLLVTAAGDIKPAELKDFLDQTFGDLPQKATLSTVKDATLQNLGQVVVEPLNIPQSLVYFAQPGINRNNPAFEAALVMMKIMGDGVFESRLWDEVREKRGLAYSVSADLNWSQHSALILGGTATKNTSAQEVIDIIRNVWQNMLQGATQAELDSAKRRMIGSFPLNFSSTVKIAKALLIYQIDNLGIDFINKRNEKISALTLDDINRAAKSFLKPEQLTFVVVGKPEGLTLEETDAKKQSKEGNNS